MSLLRQGWFKDSGHTRVHFYRKDAASSVCGRATRDAAAMEATILRGHRCRVCTRVVDTEVAL